MISGEMARVSDADSLEKAAVGSQDIITARAIDSGIASLMPGTVVAVGVALQKVRKEVLEAIGGKGRGDLIEARIRGLLREVHVKIPHQDRGNFAGLEAFKGFGKVREIVEGARR